MQRTEVVPREEARLLAERLLPRLYVDPELYQLVGEPSRVYYRVYRVGEGYAVLYVFEWPYQVIPPHKYDYAPVLVFTDSRGRPMEVYTDRYHYYVGRYLVDPEKPWWIEITGPWRSMRVRQDDPGRHQEVPVSAPLVELDEAVYARLRARETNPLKLHPTIYRRPGVIRRAKHWATITAPPPSYFVRDMQSHYRGLGWLERLVDSIARILERALDAVRERIASGVW